MSVSPDYRFAWSDATDSTISEPHLRNVCQPPLGIEAKRVIRPETAVLVEKVAAKDMQLAISGGDGVTLEAHGGLAGV